VCTVVAGEIGKLTKQAHWPEREDVAGERYHGHGHACGLGELRMSRVLEMGYLVYPQPTTGGQGCCTKGIKYDEAGWAPICVAGLLWPYESPGLENCAARIKLKEYSW
jgi:hypothetical protein